LRPTSSYNVDLPTGSAGIRGTSYRARVTFTTNPMTGETIMNIAFANADGDIVFNYNDVITGIPPQNEIEIEGTFEEEFDPESDDELPEGTFEFTDPQEMEGEEVQDIITRALRKLGQSEEEQDEQDPPAQQPSPEEEDEGEDPDPVDPEDNTDSVDPPEGDEDDFFEELSPNNNES